MRKLIYISITLLFLSCSNLTTFELGKNSEMFTTDVTFNDTIKISCLVDSGASSCNITPDILLVLVRAGTIRKQHFLESVTYRLADGSKEECKIVIIDKMLIKGRVIRNVECSVSNNLNAPILIGQSALSKLNKVMLKYGK
jgi:aspartyl protease family protein